MPHVKTSIMISADPKDVYEIAKDMPSYPDFMDDVESVEVIEEEEGSTNTKWVVRLQGRKMEWTEKDEFDEENLVIRYAQIKGDLKKFEGAWTFQPVSEGTEVTLTVDFEFGIPMIAALLHPIAKVKVKENCDMMLRGMKEKLED